MQLNTAAASVGSSYATVQTTPDNNVRFQSDFLNDVEGGGYTFPNAWLKLTRVGNTISGYQSSDGTNWTLISSATVTLDATALVGLYVSSLNTVTGTATFDNVSVTSTPTPTYSLKNFHGDTAITVGANGLPTSSVHLYDPFGQVLNSATFGTNPATSTNPGTLSNATGGALAWAASPTRKAEGMFSVPIIQMGARVYLPTLGRFASVDSIDGGTDNAYSYANDPVNGSDYSGKCVPGVYCAANTGYLLQGAPQISTVNAAPAPVNASINQGALRQATVRTPSPVQVPRGTPNSTYKAPQSPNSIVVLGTVINPKDGYTNASLSFGAGYGASVGLLFTATGVSLQLQVGVITGVSGSLTYSNVNPAAGPGCSSSITAKGTTIVGNYDGDNFSGEYGAATGMGVTWIACGATSTEVPYSSFKLK